MMDKQTGDYRVPVGMRAMEGGEQGGGRGWPEGWEGTLSEEEPEC